MFNRILLLNTLLNIQTKLQGREPLYVTPTVVYGHDYQLHKMPNDLTVQESQM